MLNMLTHTSVCVGAQTTALHKDNEVLRGQMAELEGQWAAMQAAIEDMREEAARRKEEREEMQVGLEGFIHL
jgi:hypothetical protein